MRVPWRSSASRASRETTPKRGRRGLLGPWLVASTTLDEGPTEGDSSAAELPSVEDVARTTGLSAEQAARLLDGPADEPVFIADLLRFADGTGDAYAPYREALTKAAKSGGANLVWRGRFDSQILGSAEPAFQEMVVTRYPSRAAHVATLAAPAVLDASTARVNGLALHWIYAAAAPEGGPAF